MNEKKNLYIIKFTLFLQSKKITKKRVKIIRQKQYFQKKTKHVEFEYKINDIKSILMVNLSQNIKQKNKHDKTILDPMKIK